MTDPVTTDPKGEAHWALGAQDAGPRHFESTYGAFLWIKEG